MFITLAKLRVSGAQQERVTKIKTALKKRFGGQWDDSAAFPILFIFLSNKGTDWQWVMNNTATHVKPLGFTAAVKKDLDSALPKGWQHSMTKARATSYLELIGQQMKMHKIKVPFYPDERNNVGLIPTDAPQTEASKVKGQKLLSLKDVESQGNPKPVEVKPAWPFPKSHDPETRKELEKLGRLTVGAIIEAAEALRPTPKKPLPLPSVLKQIRDLSKSHFKITMTENKSPVSGESKIIIQW